MIWMGSSDGMWNCGVVGVACCVVSGAQCSRGRVREEVQKDVGIAGCASENERVLHTEVYEGRFIMADLVVIDAFHFCVGFLFT